MRHLSGSSKAQEALSSPAPARPLLNQEHAFTVAESGAALSIDGQRCKCREAMMDIPRAPRHSGVGASKT